MKIYLAGALKNKIFIRQKMTELQQLGHQITHDWTKFETIPLIDEFPRRAVDDINGVKETDLLIAIMDDAKYAYRGTFTEIGCALGLNKNVLILCPVIEGEKNFCQTNCFYYHPLVQHFTTWNDLLEIFN